MNKVLAWLGVLLALALAQKGELRLFIWSEYIDPALLEAFTKQYGYRVRVDLYESNEEMIAKLQAGGVSQYDLIFPSDFYVPSLIQLRLVQPLDQARIPNLKNLDEKFKNPPFDPGNRYSAAYQWGTTGLIYRKDRVAAPPSWAVLFQEPKAPFVLMDSSREMLGIALRYLGGAGAPPGPGVPLLVGFCGGVGGYYRGGGGGGRLRGGLQRGCGEGRR
ncbi:MAG: spermidine/putrescine ABC transporter substrate-binding protein [Thermus sp.]|nr:spermidine/putrescine ABC transporter substrate-binding protein [Thermus sp.]MDW8358876.1 spermidine/putrescine ABC transporter substrate-binding protein [Thermus sp.]